MGMLENYVSALQGVPLNEAIPGGAGTTPQGSPTALSNMIVNALSLPKQAIEGASHDVANLGQDVPMESVGPAFETARMLAGAGAPMAEAGAAGAFGGDLALTANLQKKALAESMIANGRYPDEVFAQTGWMRHPADQKFRFEIPDNNMRLNYMPTGEGETAIGKIGDLVNSPQLFQAYPALKNIEFRLTKDSTRPNGQGGYSDVGDASRIHVNAPDMDIARSITAHELQHGIQGIQKFSYGADPSYYSDLIGEGLMKNPSLLPKGEDRRRLLAEIFDQAYPLYHKTAGEVEARNVQSRLGWSPSQRTMVPPWYSQDVPYAEQIHHDPVTGIIRALKP